MPPAHPMVPSRASGTHRRNSPSSWRCGRSKRQSDPPGLVRCNNGVTEHAIPIKVENGTVGIVKVELRPTSVDWDRTIAQRIQIRRDLLKWNDDGGNWTDVLTIPAPAGRFGWVTSLSGDGLRLAVSAPNAQIGQPGGGRRRILLGSVRASKWW